MDSDFTIQNLIPKSLVQEFGSPLYVYDEEIIKRQCQTITTALKNSFDQGAKVLYACKANTNPNILKIMRSNGVHGIDAVSPNEVEVALQAGFLNNQITYTANYMTKEEIEYAIQKGVILNVGEIDTLKKLIAYQAEVIIRLNLDIGIGHHNHVNTGGNDSKFGINLMWKEQLSEIQKQGVKIIGLHQHMGSKIMKKDHDSYLLGIEKLFQAATQELELPYLKYIDIGGGFGVKYQDYEETSDLNLLFSEIKKLYDKYFINVKPMLFIEPGRYLIAESGYLLCTVQAINTNKSRTFVGTDSGMHHLIRPALYESYHEIINSEQKQVEPRIVTVCGNICESGDLLGVDRNLKVEVSDVLVIQNGGAYGFSMSSNYNLRERPAEILVRDSKPYIIRKRETLDYLLANVVIL
ncbi:unnamed protein product [Paramecium octaurelia]|uniref:Diaminopimelate decarboxylase n=1 Tax=Paramecium octaurelia TaxID=43137 RepID=A0A8S1W0Z2_PAROT|nr:unnamed protein product [Paramecium octaurelia]